MAARHNTGSLFFAPTPERLEDKMDLKSADTEGTLSSVTTALRKILHMTAQTSEEKFKILDARDKLYKILRDRDPSLKRRALIATCPDMCPEKERLLRDYQGRGSLFEMTNFSKNSNFNHSLAVKEYSRSSADQEEPLPQDLRPVHVLTMTMSHLLHNVVDYCELTDDNIEEWYMFMWDRTRALRKELTQQGVCSLESVTLVEQCARFHIHSAERLVAQDSSIYDDKINTENLTKCLQTLKYMYKDLAKEDVKCPNESEFICYSLLLNLNNSSVFTELSDMSDSLMTSGPVKFALDVMTAWETRNYIRFFNLVKNTTYLNCCLLRRYFGEMRLYAVKTMIRSYCTKTYSPQILLSRFVDHLNFEGEEECFNFLSLCNFNFHKINGKSVVNFDRSLFQNPKTTITTGRAYLFIEEKKQRPLSVVMAGGYLPPKLFQNYVPQDSFTESGDLKPDALPNSDLMDLFSAPLTTHKFEGFDAKEESHRSAGDFSLKEEQLKSTSDSRSQKRMEQTTGFSSDSVFFVKEPNPPSSNLFCSSEPSSFAGTSETPNIFNRPSQTTTVKNIFDSSPVNPFAKSIFGSQTTSTVFSNQKFNIFGSESAKVSFSFDSSLNQQSERPSNSGFFSETKNEPKNFASNFQFMPNNEEEKSNEEQERNEKLERERLERERIRKEREEEEKRRRDEENALLERKRLQEENRKREMERKEKERQEERERLKREELMRHEAEERNRRETKAKQEKLKEATARQLAELKQQEENKRKIELEHRRKIDKKMIELKNKYQKWKTKIFFEKWRINTWSSIEERKMKEYFKKVKLKYPPVCSEEILNGNPYGMLIPSMLTFEKFQNWRKEFVQTTTTKKMVILNADMPLLKLGCILGKALEERAKSLKSKLDPFPWKLVISVPDEAESPKYWKNIETFVEMHFVEDVHWQFGIQKEPLICRSSNYGSFRFIASVRRLRGPKLFEGSEPNPSAVRGCNALIFFVVEQETEITRSRLIAVLSCKPPLPKIPVIVLALNGQLKPSNYKKLLGLEALERTQVSNCHLIQVVDGKHSVIAQLIRCCNLAATHSAPPSRIRINQLSDFLVGDWLNLLWRRIEISLSNFKVIVQGPKILIEFYNSCIKELADFFLDKSYEEQTLLAQEFSKTDMDIPKISQDYKEKLKSYLNRLTLPHWPLEIPKSCHQLNYRIHQYCKKVVAQDKVKLKNLKWILYRIIRRSLLWKGLDIYCDEDINQIIGNFPWIEVFQEITRVLTRQLNEDLKSGKNLAVLYDIDKLENLSFASSLISKFFKKFKRQSPKKLAQSFGEEKIEESTPCLEKDSVVYAYSAAIEREKSKRKRGECIDESLDILFSSSAGKRLVLEEEEPKTFDFSEIESNFQNLSDRLDGMKKLMLENSKILTGIQNQIEA